MPYPEPENGRCEENLPVQPFDQGTIKFKTFDEEPDFVLHDDMCKINVGSIQMTINKDYERLSMNFVDRETQKSLEILEVTPDDILAASEESQRIGMLP